MALKTMGRPSKDMRMSTLYDDTIAPSLANFETSPTTLENDENNLRSAIRRILHTTGGNWWDTAIRGMDDLHADLNTMETKAQCYRAPTNADITVGASDNFVVLSVAGSEAPSETAAVGAVTTEGAVVAAHGGTFGTHALTEVAGTNALRPKNLCIIVDGSTGDPILSGGKQVHGLLQSEVATDGHTFNDTTQQVQISFVIANATNDDLIACPAVDIQGSTINYGYVIRKQSQNVPEDAYLGDSAWLDLAAAVDVTRENSYANQGVTPVTPTLDATLDLATGKFWEIGDAASAALLKITEGSAGGTSTFQVAAGVDTFDVDAVNNDFLNGATFGTSGTGVQVAETAGIIERAANLTIYASGAGELLLHDSNIDGETTWAQAGVKLSETMAEVAAYETAFGGEVSLMNAIVAAKNTGGHSTPTRATVTADTAADVDVGGVGGGSNLDAQLPDLSSGTFTSNHMLYLDGKIMWPGANAAANADYYPGTSLANGQVKFEDDVEVGDVIQVVTIAA